jgi:hypothetical protein
MKNKVDVVKTLLEALPFIKKFSNADAGTIYLISKDGKYLEFVIVHTDQKSCVMIKIWILVC